MEDIIELLHSNDPNILGKYYNDIETITGLEDGLTKTLSSNDRLDPWAKILLVEARRIFSNKKKKKKDIIFGGKENDKIRTIQKIRRRSKKRIKY